MNRSTQRIVIFALALAAGTIGPASAATDPGTWKKEQLQAWEGKLSHELDAEHSASEILANYGNHHVEIAHREATGSAELHETQNDIFFIVSGEATLIQGGTLVDPKTTEPHEVEGKSISGGTSTKLAAGDVVHIAFKVPHQLVVEKGKQVTYFVVKIDAH
jgi:mannose-6-phosphate isomerase-like protein (cupin superfamily)